jgi:hypothetical protein
MIDEKQLLVAQKYNQFRLSQSRRETLETSLEVERERLNQIRHAIKSWIAPALAQDWEEQERRLAQLEQSLTDAKKLEKQDKEAVSSCAFLHAVETGASGRELHPNINVATTDEICLPYDTGAFVSWLVSQGRRQDVTIKIYSLDFYRMHRNNGTLPAGVELKAIPLIRIDSKE